jgi:hypothetical protein
MPESLPPAVIAFITAHLRTIDDLHLLVATADERGRWWDASTVARELVMGVHDARGLLEHLAAHNLLDIRVTGDVRYQYKPGTPELASAAQASLAAFRANPAAVWRTLARQHGGRAARDFADAFRIRRDTR